MNESTLLALGFEINAGAIDRGGKCYGRLSPDGIELTPAGRALVEDLTVEMGAPAQPARKTTKKKAEAEVPAPSVTDIDDLLGGTPE